MKVLVIEDHEMVRWLYRAIFRRLPGVEADFAEDYARGVELIDSFKPDLVLTDLSLPKGNGLQVLEYVQQSGRDVPVILVSGSVLDAEYSSLAERGFKRVIRKPFPVTAIEEAIQAFQPAAS